MSKEEILQKIEEYKDRPIIVGLADSGSVLMGNLPGRWLFAEDDYIVEIRINTADTVYEIPGTTQGLYPFKIVAVPFEIVNYVQSFIGATPGDIANSVANLTPIGTTKTLDEITKEIESNSIRKAQSTRGALNDPHVAPGTDYGAFTGSMISTEINGLPKYVKDALNN